MTVQLLHERYLPFTREQLSQHFAEVHTSGSPERHLRYYTDSISRGSQYAEQSRNPAFRPTPGETGLARQMEKDERFWVATALMNLFHADGGERRAGLLAGLLTRAGLAHPEGFDSWTAALAGTLHLYFEVNLPSPPKYNAWLRTHVDERTPIPFLQEFAAANHRGLEGATKVDAMLLAPDTGLGISFEAKVLSDVSTHIRYDMARNQLARNIDVLLDANCAPLAQPLISRKPKLSYLVLLTPDLLRDQEAEGAAAKSRLYGWLMPAYQDPASTLLGQHLPHRTAAEVAGAAGRLGWASWEDCNDLLPGACSWLPFGRIAALKSDAPATIGRLALE